MSQQVDLGAVTAYASAVEGGYTGTYNEFKTLIASFANTAASISTAMSGKIDQVSTMPTASSTYEDKVVQFIGTTDQNYTHGYFYECVEDDGSYSWSNIPVSAGGDISGKADKVSSATNGDLASLDSNGNLVDSGLATSNLVTKSQTTGLLKNDGTVDTTTYISDKSDKADKVASAVNGNFAALDSNGNLTDSGSKASDFLTSHQDITGKADKVTSATNGNFAGLDENGNLTDSGSKASDFLGQVDTMPAASADNYKKIVQYIGASTNDYTHGYFYECTHAMGTQLYYWMNVPVSEGGGTGGGHTIQDNAGTSMTQRAGLQFEGMGVTDDSTNDRTKVKLPIFNGTTAEWTALSSTEKAKYQIVNLSDDYSSCPLYVQTSTITGETTEIEFPSGLTMKNALLQNVFIKYSHRWYTPEGLAHYKASGATGGYAVAYPSADNNTSNKTIIQLISGDYSRFVGCEVRIVFLVASTDFLPSAL